LDSESELGRHLEPILNKHRDKVKLRFFDVEFYSARVTDIWQWGAVNHHAHEYGRLALS
jgi:hypothetical protein